ncbi:MAG: bifunctional 5,10-methylenetetrahydrofolate dehydrogenase/5,10-methenyltetrahydrofolate cyclohydrolase [Bacillus subtilis]|nr:bifunctional 5,10-methylenetetrahydrofolate dehydrogenase/5,10-methenyltetrahydrofolate cyclohydrolase [Bacillus subtilis]
MASKPRKFSATKSKKKPRHSSPRYGVTPHLSVILVGDNAASESYVRGKEIACQESRHQKYRRSAAMPAATADQLTTVIDALERRFDSVHGILLQLPIPKHLDSDYLRQSDSRSRQGRRRLHRWKTSPNWPIGKPHLVPCTPLGVMRFLERYHIAVSGKNAVVVGRSQIVGKPMASLLLKDNATVTICHSKTPKLARRSCKPPTSSSPRSACPR